MIRWWESRDFPLGHAIGFHWSNKRDQNIPQSIPIDSPSRQTWKFSMRDITISKATATTKTVHKIDPFIDNKNIETMEPEMQTTLDAPNQSTPDIVASGGEETSDGNNQFVKVEAEPSNPPSIAEKQENNNDTTTTTESNEGSIHPLVDNSQNYSMERHVFELLFKTIWALLRNTLEASSLFAQLMNVLDSSRLEETVACHHSLKQASKPSSGIIGFVYVDKNGEVSPPPENRNGVRVFKEPRRENLEEGEKGILCAILPGAAGEMFDEADIDSVLRDGTYSLKRRSQCLHLVQFPSEFGTNLVVMQELQDKIQIGVDQIFGGMNSDSNTNAT
eukprot:CAMPEP_0116864014 /NCGR_PEP_ID=MMETSP0418-20121206/24575_1 /TAXON_ID=1158023 /ORGANISM="Astrosyne radiata, Strain 13vi08-1A" /LENGTH=332 /DNA_ID=CAMNT_0004499165 /DNA_START=826 /DNA_END=1820 /DNA_ORIENTATION=-